MSKKFGICCVKCQQVLSNEDDIFGTSCGHLYHFHCIRSCHGKSTKCMHCEAYKPIMFKMHFKFDDPPVTRKFQELCEKLNNHEKINALLISTNNKARETIQQHEEEIKTLKDALQAKEVTVKELNDRIETMEAFSQYLTTNGIEKSAMKQQPNNKYNNYGFKDKQKWAENNKAAAGNYYDAKKVESNSSRIGNQNHNGGNYTDHQQETVANTSNGGHNTIAQEAETRRNTVVMIRNFKSSDLSTDSALANVMGLAEQMRLTLTTDHIKEINVLPEDKNLLTYMVYFTTKHMKEQFLQNIHLLKQSPATKFLIIF